MDQDVPGVGRMLFHLWVVPYQWSVLIKNNIMPPREHWYIKHDLVKADIRSCDFISKFITKIIFN